MKIRSLFLSALFAASSAFALPITYSAQLSGLNESPANGSPGTGFAFITFDTAARTL